MTNEGNAKTSRPSRAAVESAKNLWRELTAATKASSAASKQLLNACATQVQLAKYKDSGKNIRPLSLNTLKAAAEIAVESGGWAAMNELRRQAHLHGLNDTEAKAKTDRTLGHRLTVKEKQIDNLTNANQQLLKNRTMLLEAYSDILKILKTYSSLSPDLAAQLARHESMFDVRKVKQTGGTND